MLNSDSVKIDCLYRLFIVEAVDFNQDITKEEAAATEILKKI